VNRMRTRLTKGVAQGSRGSKGKTHGAAHSRDERRANFDASKAQCYAEDDRDFLLGEEFRFS